MITHPGVTGPNGGPPTLVRLKRRLGLPVPVAWRSWVAADILGTGWQDRHNRRRARLTAVMCAYFVVLVVEAVSLGVVLRTYLFAGPMIVTPIGPVVGVLIGKRREQTQGIDPARVARLDALSWHGLRMDGTVDPHPDKWTTLAAASSAQVTGLLVVGIVVGLAVVAGLVILPVWAAFRLLSG